ncbi:hypothetical protein HG531_007002 [Fusarium graminearum]|nr:hypothetical protein HG531_007002 [Fusarium graminearum]
MDNEWPTQKQLRLAVRYRLPISGLTQQCSVHHSTKHSTTSLSINALLARHTNTITNHEGITIKILVLLHDIIHAHARLLGDIIAGIVLLDSVRDRTLWAIRDRDAFLWRRFVAEEPKEKQQRQDDEHEEVEEGPHLCEPRHLGLIILRARHEEGLGFLAFRTRFANLGEMAVLIARRTLPVASVGVAERVDLAVSIVAYSLHALW